MHQMKMKVLTFGALGALSLGTVLTIGRVPPQLKRSPSSISAIVRRSWRASRRLVRCMARSCASRRCSTPAASASSAPSRRRETLMAELHQRPRIWGGNAVAAHAAERERGGQPPRSTA